MSSFVFTGFCKKALMPTSLPRVIRLASFIAEIMTIFALGSIS